MPRFDFAGLGLGVLETVATTGRSNSPINGDAIVDVVVIIEGTIGTVEVVVVAAFGDGTTTTSVVPELRAVDDGDVEEVEAEAAVASLLVDCEHSNILQIQY